jgi:hypothetical protein
MLVRDSVASLRDPPRQRAGALRLVPLVGATIAVAYAAVTVYGQGYVGAAILVVLFSAIALFIGHASSRWFDSLLVPAFSYYVVVAHFVRTANELTSEKAAWHFSWNSRSTFHFEGSQLSEALTMIMLGYMGFVGTCVALQFALRRFATAGRTSAPALPSRFASRFATYRRGLFLTATLLISAQFVINWVMFSRNIGIVGIDTEQPLPLRVGGALYYYRYYIFPAVLAYFIIMARARSWAVAVGLLETAWAGLSSLSRSLVMLHAAGLMFGMRVGSGKDAKKPYAATAIVAVAAAFLFQWVTLARGYAYELSPVDPQLELGPLLARPIEDLWEDGVVVFVASMLTGPFLRLLGLHEFLTAYFTTAADSYGWTPFLERYFAIDVTNVPGFVYIKELFGYSLDVGGGVALDIFGNIYRCSGTGPLYFLLTAGTAALATCADLVASRAARAVGTRQLYYALFVVIMFKFMEGWYYEILMLSIVIAVLLACARVLKSRARHPMFGRVDAVTGG